MAKRLTQKYIESLYGVSANGEFGDHYTPGLRVILRPTSRHLFCLRRSFKGKPRKLTLGPISDHSLEEARGWAIEKGRSFDNGIDPVQDKKCIEEASRLRASKTCDWLFGQYMRYQEGRITTADELRRIYELDIQPAIGRKSYFDVEHDDLANILQKKVTDTPYASNKICRLMYHWFGWSVVQGRHISGLHASPAAFLVELGDEKERDRYLNDNEISMFFTSLTCRRSSFEDPLKVCLYTDARRGEVFSMRWSEIDISRGDWFIPKSRTKKRVGLLLPLPPVVMSMISRAAETRRDRQDLVWPSKASLDRPMSGFGNISRDLNKDMKMIGLKKGLTVEQWRIHDLRRTFSTGINGLLDASHRPLVPPHVVDRLLNHKPSGPRAIYNRHEYYAEKKAALQIWADHLETLVVK